MIDHPWPEDAERVESRLRALVGSVVEPGELRSLRVEWTTPSAHHFDDADAGWIALRLTVVAGDDDEVFQKEIWDPDRGTTWDAELEQLASDLEARVCETSFAWGQQRTAHLPG